MNTKTGPLSVRSPIFAWHSIRVWIATLAILALASCERTASKSDYVSARVAELCQGEANEDPQACRLAVIKQFLPMSLEELKRRYPKPELQNRPSCGF